MEEGDEDVKICVREAEFNLTVCLMIWKMSLELQHLCIFSPHRSELDRDRRLVQHQHPPPAPSSPTSHNRLHPVNHGLQIDP